MKQPFHPRVKRAFEIRRGLARRAFRNASVITDVVLVDERKERERRLVRPAAARIGVDVPEQRAGEGREIRIGRLVGPHERLELVHRHLAVTVLSERPPRHPARDEEVRRHIEPRFRTGGEKPVELTHPLRIDRRAVRRSLRQRTLVVVDANRVVAEMRDPVGKRLRVRIVDEVRGEAEVHAVEALRHAGTPLELEVSVTNDDASVLPRRRVDAADFREVERAPDLHSGGDGERQPVRIRPDDGIGIGRRGQCNGRKHDCNVHRSPFLDITRTG